MKKSTIILVLLLICSNVYWAIKTIDHGITSTYRETSFDSVQNSLETLLKLSIPLLHNKSSSEIRALAKGKISDSDIFEKPNAGDDGETLLVVGEFIFHLDSDNRVEKVSHN